MLLPLDQLTLTVKKGLNTPTNCVLPPASILTMVRDWLAATGKAPMSEDAMFAAPNPINSRFASTFSPLFPANDRAVSTASVNIMRVRARAQGSRARMSPCSLLLTPLCFSPRALRSVHFASVMPVKSTTFINRSSSRCPRQRAVHFFPLVVHHVNDSCSGEYQDVVGTGRDIHPVGVGNSEPLLGDLRHLVASIAYLIFMIQDMPPVRCPACL